MFTGIIEEKGTIKAVTKGRNSSRITIQGERIFGQLKLGDSVAVNGVCLTVCELGSNTFVADVMGETLSRSNLGELTSGSLVNLERAMPVDGRFGGHIVSGHIDGIGNIVSMKKDEVAVWIKVSAPPSIMAGIVEKGSITIDGISLTVARVEEKAFQVSVIPHTAAETTLLDKRIGSTVNLENDIIGKYVEKLLGVKAKTNGSVTAEFLVQNGF